MIVEGTILRGRRFEPIEGRIVIEDGMIVAFEEAANQNDDVVLPAFVNAHTHVGDSIAKEAGEGLSLEALVAPPDGLKHRLLREADRSDLIEGMRRSARYMQAGGTAFFLDFRENGVDGVEMLREATDGLDVEPVIFGRETVDAMHAGDGFGASGALDGEFGRERTATARAEKPFAIHAGEADSRDLNPALDLDPDFLIHVVHPEPLHLERIEDRGVPVVICPRSNLVTGVGVPPIAELAARTTVALGTDNVFLNSPSMFREMAYASKLSGLPARDVLAMATVAGAELVGLNCGLIEEGRDAKLLVLDGDSDNLAGSQDLLRAVVRRAGMADVKKAIL